MPRSSYASLVRRAMAPIAASLVLAACGSREPAAPASAPAPLVQRGALQLRAAFEVPAGRGAGDTLWVVVTARNTSAAPVTIETSPCTVSVRLLAAAAGAGASATFHDDFQRPCARMLVMIPLAAGATHTFRHPVPMSEISPAAPRAVQAHVQVDIAPQPVLLTGGTFTLP